MPEALLFDFCDFLALFVQITHFGVFSAVEEAIYSRTRTRSTSYMLQPAAGPTLP